jgi:hypothetical protein
MAVSSFKFCDTTPVNFGNIGTDGSGSYFPLVFPQATTAGSTIVVFAGKSQQGNNLTGACSDTINGSYTLLETQPVIAGGNASWNLWVFQNAASVGAGAYGRVTSANTTSLTDTSQSWTTNQWTGKTLIDLLSNLTYTVTSNTATTLNFSAGTSPNVGDFYVVGPFVRIGTTIGQGFGDYSAGVAIEMTTSATSGTIAHSSHLDTTSNAGTNNITSGTADCGSLSGTMIAVSLNAEGNSFPFVPLAGTGFTDLGAFFTDDGTGTTLRVESKHFSTSPGVTGATWGAQGIDQFGSFMAFVPDAPVNTAILSWY